MEEINLNKITKRNIEMMNELQLSIYIMGTFILFDSLTREMIGKATRGLENEQEYLGNNTLFRNNLFSIILELD